MLFDWFTVSAQVVNFLILVWLMKRFLYQPILHAIDAREKRIATEIADADRKRAEAEKEREEFQHKNEEFDRQRAALLSQARDEAQAERQRLLDEARQTADALRARRHDALQREHESLNDEIARRTREEVFAVARKTLMDLAGTSLEERISEAFMRRLRELSDEAKADLAKALKTSSDPVLVRSAFDLPAEQRAAIQHALDETFSTDPSTPLRAGIQVRFETAPDMISGVELTVTGRKVAWSIAHYLASLEKRVGELLKERSTPAVKPEPKLSKPEPETKSQ